MLTALMVAASDAPVMGTQDHGEVRSFSPMAGDPVWTDTLDDAGHVYVNATMPVGVEVSGGDAHLRAGASEGWLASEQIPCPAGYRYDLVLLEADTPGRSSVKISVLDASRPPATGEFANATITGYHLMEAKDLSLNLLSTTNYPRIRVQVNLIANGTDRPRLLAWTVLFVPDGEWREDFLGTGKMSMVGGMEISDGKANIRSGQVVLGEDDYDPYPPIAAAMDYGVRPLYVDDNGTGYGELMESLEDKMYHDLDFDDLNADGYMDLIVSDGQTWGDIFWGSASGTFSDTDRSPLNYPSLEFAIGDFNGDGWKDLAGAVPYGWGSASLVMLNQGGGAFAKDVNISFPGVQASHVSAGDVNGDGYDDVIFARGQVNVYYGGPWGPDTTCDVTLPGNMCHVDDLDADGIADIVVDVGFVPNLDIQVYLGGSPEMDDTVDHNIDLPYESLYEIDSGDINGDGHTDIVCAFSTENSSMVIIPGSATGWSASSWRSYPQYDHFYRLAIGDLDKDGCDDLVYNDADSTWTATNLSIAYGRSGWPTGPDFTLSRKMADGRFLFGFALAIPKGGNPVKSVMGTIITEEIMLPTDSKWDILHLEGERHEGSWSKLSVLDRNGDVIPGYLDLPGWSVDLSDVDPDINPVIRVKVTIGCPSEATPPSMDRLTLWWMDRSAWRDRFYGSVRVDRAMNMAVKGGTLVTSDPDDTGPSVLLPSFMGEGNEYLPATVFTDAGHADYLANAPFSTPVLGSSAVDAADIDRDGHAETMFAVYRTAFDTYRTKSPIYRGSHLGPGVTPLHEFNTQAATDVLLEDLNGDGHHDVVFAQERDMGTYHVDSILFWGSANGWSATPDVRFKTRGATDVEAADVNGDRKLDLVFACGSDDSGTSTDSMVFLQDGAGFSGSDPSHRLPTMGASAVCAADLDNDAAMDLVFACERDGNLMEIESLVYWGSASGGFDPTPTGLPTLGARDVIVADLDGDLDLDIVFANSMNDTHSHQVPSYVYLNDDFSGFASTHDVGLPTSGATGVDAGDVDGRGWMDLAFACERDDEGFDAESALYLGGMVGYATSPDVLLPTVGASDVMLVDLTDVAGYVSQEISTEDASRLGAFDTLRYTGSLGPSQKATLRVLDGETWEVLCETPVLEGTNEWRTRDLIKVKAHPTVRISAIVSRHDEAFSLDDLWINWTDRVKRPPTIIGLEAEDPAVLRTNSTVLWIDVADEYDLTSELAVDVSHRLDGSGDAWSTDMVRGAPTYNVTEGRWTVVVEVPADANVGLYEFTVAVTDVDLMGSRNDYPGFLEVLNNVPSAPVVRIVPDELYTDTMAVVEIVEHATDKDALENATYRYQWYRDGVMVEGANAANLLPGFTAKGENWSVEVWAWDGIDEGPVDTAWMVILNSPPRLLVTPEGVTIDEDGPAWLIDLHSIIEDADGDVLEWSLSEDPTYITVVIDQGTGQVTLTTSPDWHGTEKLTFVASDGEASVSASVMVSVLSVNDVPRFLEVNGEPVLGYTVAIETTNGQTLVVTYSVVDVEDDVIWSEVDSNIVELDEAKRELRIHIDEDYAGTFEFTLNVWDLVSPDDKVSLKFQVTVTNVNDPMGEPSITSPAPGTTVEPGEVFTLAGECTDPDVQFGQVLTFTWTSNISGPLGTGPSLTLSLQEEGTHLITLTVRDGEFERSSMVEVQVRSASVEPPPDDDDDDAGGGGMANWVWIAIIVVAVLAVFGLLFLTKRGGDEGPEEGGWIPPDVEGTLEARENADDVEGPGLDRNPFEPPRPFQAGVGPT